MPPGRPHVCQDCLERGSIARVDRYVARLCADVSEPRQSASDLAPGDDRVDARGDRAWRRGGTGPRRFLERKTLQRRVLFDADVEARLVDERRTSQEDEAGPRALGESDDRVRGDTARSTRHHEHRSRFAPGNAFRVAGRAARHTLDDHPRAALAEADLEVQRAVEELGDQGLRQSVVGSIASLEIDRSHERAGPFPCRGLGEGAETREPSALSAGAREREVPTGVLHGDKRAALRREPRRDASRDAERLSVDAKASARDAMALMPPRKITALASSVADVVSTASTCRARSRETTARASVAPSPSTATLPGPKSPGIASPTAVVRTARTTLRCASAIGAGAGAPFDGAGAIAGTGACVGAVGRAADGR